MTLPCKGRKLVKTSAPKPPAGTSQARPQAPSLRPEHAALARLRTLAQRRKLLLSKIKANPHLSALEMILRNASILPSTQSDSLSLALAPPLPQPAWNMKAIKEFVDREYADLSTSANFNYQLEFLHSNYVNEITRLSGLSSQFAVLSEAQCALNPSYSGISLQLYRGLFAFIDNKFRESIIARAEQAKKSQAEDDVGNKPKVSTFTDIQVQVLQNWYLSHWRNPYPTNEERDRLAVITGLQPRQIGTWLSNFRGRYKNHLDKLLQQNTEWFVKNGVEVPETKFPFEIQEAYLNTIRQYDQVTPTKTSRKD